MRFAIHAGTFFTTLKKAGLFTDKDDGTYYGLDKIAFRPAGKDTIIIESLCPHYIYRNVVDVQGLEGNPKEVYKVHPAMLAGMLKAAPRIANGLADVVLANRVCTVSYNGSTQTFPCDVSDWPRTDDFFRKFDNMQMTRDEQEKKDDMIGASAVRRQSIWINPKMLLLVEKVWKDTTVQMLIHPDRQMFRFASHEADDRQAVIAMGCREKIYDE